MGRPTTVDKCKLRQLGPHAREIVLGALGRKRKEANYPPCNWWSYTSTGGYPVAQWSCGHEEVCATCGEILRFSVSVDECPHYVIKGRK